MKSSLFLIFLFSASHINSVAQSPFSTFKFVKDDGQFIVPGSETLLQNFKFKGNLDDGIYFGYYDNEMSKPWLKFQIVRKQFSGTYQEWDEHGVIVLDQNYVNGHLNGMKIQKLLIEGSYLVNIEFFVNGKLDEIYYSEW